ncbi:cytochrome P450 [Mycena rebaudengoi]|nr:cytochrome P450 [Mycena rebaudengoi]
MNVENLALPFLTVCGVVTILYLKRNFSSRLPLPPGPKKLPLVGNFFQMPRHSEWETYTLWSKEYNSDIIHLNVAGTSIILLSSVQAAEDLLHKRSAIYSGRSSHKRWPHTAREPALVSPPSRFLKKLPSARYRKARQLLRLLLKDPDSFAEHFEYIRSSNSTQDVIPALKYVPSWFPGVGFHAAAGKVKHLIKEMVDPPFEAVRRAMETGTARPCFVSNTLASIEEKLDKHSAENNIKHVAATTFAAGTDTTRVTILVFVLAMLLNPNVQKKAQEQIDAVVGPGHLPECQDEEALPYAYLTSLPKKMSSAGIEFLRAWWYSRILDGRLNPAVEPDAAFGWGRRACPGRGIGWNMLWIMAASILAAFDITKAVGEDGEVIEPALGHTSDLTTFPVPFKCSIKPRSKQAADLILFTGNS